MPPNATLKEKLAAGQEVRVMFVGPIPNPKLIEFVGMMGGLDGVWIDQEHAGLTTREMETLLMAARAAGLDAFARVPPTDYATVMRPMEGGASGVMIAQIRTVAEVEQAVRWAKYHPVGERGLFLASYEARFGSKPPADHVADANRDRWITIQIETAEAVDCVEKIAATPGVDCLFIGPSDLSNNLGKPGDLLNPVVLSAIERVAAAAKANGIAWGILARNEEFALRCRKLGCQLFSLTGDLDCFARGFTATKEAFPAFFGKSASSQTGK